MTALRKTRADQPRTPRAMALPALPAGTAPERSRHVCLGPIANLEAHLPEAWWQTLFDALYVQTDGDVVENPEAARADIDQVLAHVALGRHADILDLCCGQGRHALELAARGYGAAGQGQILGLDRSRYLIRLARQRAEANGLPVAFREGDARRPRLPEASRDLVMCMGNSFGYFADADDDIRVLRAALRVLRPGGRILLDLCEGAQMARNFAPRSWEWIDAHHFVCRERSLSREGERLISREVIVHDERGVIADQFYAERLYTPERIAKALEIAGFRNVRFPESEASRSTRDQDLGMLGWRMWVVAEAPPRAVPPRGKARRQPLDVTVIMGDPGLPDAVKRTGRFSAEDLATVRKLKAGLAQVPGYRFRYLDRHATLAEDLARDSAALVFNLCDEGYANDAFKELHVPALLEMLDRPYTGAGPQALAVCYDKSLVRAMAAAMDIPVPLASHVGADDQMATLPGTFPALVKPNFGDSSLGIDAASVVHDEAELLSALARLRQRCPGSPALVQEFLTGPEVTVGLIGNANGTLQALPVLGVDYSALPEGMPPILGYESKWLPDSPYWTQLRYGPAVLDAATERSLIDASEKLFIRLGCRDYARFDFRADGAGTYKLLEVNPNPGWCWDGKMAIMADLAGLDYAGFLGAVLGAASERLALSRASSSRASSA